MTETIDAPNIEGRWESTEITISETNRIGPNVLQTKRDTFSPGANRERRLVQTTLSTQETLPNNDTKTVQDTYAADLNGHKTLVSRQVENTRSPGVDTYYSVATRLEPGVDGVFRESARTEYSERQSNPGVVDHTSTQLVRDVNGRWQVAETRNGYVRTIGTSERLEEQTIRRSDLSGNLITGERTVVRHSEANGQKDVVSETYVPNADGFARSDLALSRRVRTSTTSSADGSPVTVEEIEERNPVAPGDPMRVTRRTVTTERKGDPNRGTTTRQVFALDVNGRLAPLAKEIGESNGK